MFEHLSQLDPQGTSWLELPMISPDAAVELRFAGESNRGYFNAMLARAGKRVRQLQARGPQAAIDPKMVADNRAEDRALFPVHVLVGWRGILDTSGQPVEPSPEARREFCEKVPTWIFDQIRNHAGTAERFLLPGQELPPDAAELAKN